MRSVERSDRNPKRKRGNRLASRLLTSSTREQKRTGIFVLMRVLDCAVLCLGNDGGVVGFAMTVAAVSWRM